MEKISKGYDEFKKFISKGNVLDLAVGVLLGSSFGKIVTSLVNDIIMPPIGVLIGKVNFSELKYDLPGSDEAAIRYGAFIQSIVDFLIIGLSIFIIIKIIGRFIKKKEEEPAKVVPTRQEELLEEIRDLLKTKK